MSPLELIKNGIIENDLEKIAQGYNALTGESISPTTTDEPVREPVTGTTESEDTESNKVSSPMRMRSEIEDFAIKRDNLPVGKYGRKETIQVGENQFVDDGTEAVGKEFETPKIAPTPRRKPVKMIEVVCHACGKKEEVNPAYKTGNYHRCARCVG
jgi:hypothetical protein|tara:strand:+ start:108 stop:575 length:468 start_codon:yes stop_codon:yes gene_type:complete